MRFLLPALLALSTAVFAADPNEARILQLLGKVLDQGAGELTLEAKETGPGFAVYVAKRVSPDGKKTNVHTLIFQPGQKKVIVGDYFNLARFKDKINEPDFLSQFLSNAMGSSVKVTAGEAKPDGTLLTVMQETGYGKVNLPAHLFGRFHFIMGKTYGLDEDPAAARVRGIRWDKGGTLGPAGAPNTLAVFLDMECPHCARVEEQILGLLKTRTDIRAGFFQFPLTIGHPLAFKAAAAAHCYLDRGSELYFEFMGYFYPLRKEVEFATVDLTNYGFAELKGLEEPFLACYMKPANIASVLDAMQMAIDLGVNHTPMILYNGLSYLPSDFIALHDPEAAKAKPAPAAAPAAAPEAAPAP